ncbi:hypothetical protein IGK89_000821 [Enterococcus sp. DIV0007]|nr:hypothetical protein EA89_01057 [Enterococcus faecium]
MYPFLNILMSQLNNKKWLCLISVLTIMLSIIPTVFYKGLWNSNLMWFIYMYLLGGALRNYENEISTLLFKHHLTWKRLTLITFLIIVSTIIALDLMGEYLKIEIIAKKSIYFTSMENILSLLLTISLFMYFNSITIKNNRFINTIASSTLGVYMLHMFPNSTNFIWRDIFNSNKYYDSSFASLIINSIVSITVATLCMMIISLFVDQCIFKVYDKLMNIFLERIKHK